MREAWHRPPTLLAHWLRQVYRNQGRLRRPDKDAGTARRPRRQRGPDVGRFGTGGLVPVFLRRRTVGVVAAGRAHARLSARVRDPDDRVGAVTQAPRRLPADRPPPRPDPPTPPSLQ